MKANRSPAAEWREEGESLVEQEMGRNRRRAVLWKEHQTRYPKMTGPARVSWDNIHKGPCNG